MFTYLIFRVSKSILYYNAASYLYQPYNYLMEMLKYNLIENCQNVYILGEWQPCIMPFPILHKYHYLIQMFK